MDGNKRKTISVAKIGPGGISQLNNSIYGIAVWTRDLADDESRRNIESWIGKKAEAGLIPFMGREDLDPASIEIDLGDPFWKTILPRDKRNLEENRGLVQGMMWDALKKTEGLEDDNKKLVEATNAGRTRIQQMLDDSELQAFQQEPFLEQEEGIVTVTGKSGRVHTDTETINNFGRISEILRDKISSSGLRLGGKLDGVDQVEVLTKCVEQEYARETPEEVTVRYHPNTGEFWIPYQGKTYVFATERYGMLKEVHDGMTREGTILPEELDNPLPTKLKKARKAFIHGDGEVCSYHISLDDLGCWDTVDVVKTSVDTDPEIIMKTHDGLQLPDETDEYSEGIKEIRRKHGPAEDVTEFHIKGSKIDVLNPAKSGPRKKLVAPTR